MSYLVDAFVDGIEWGPAVGRGTTGITRDDLPSRVPLDDVDVGSENVEPLRLSESTEFQELVRLRLTGWTGYYPVEFTVEILTVTHSSECIEDHDV